MVLGSRSSAAQSLGTGILLLLTSVLVAAPERVEGQRLTYSKGQAVYPAYEGWTEKPDGTRAFLFGYMNENWEETPRIPVGSENRFSPGPADRGQPTYFLPRRNRFVFEVPVPEGFEVDDELVWTLEANGQEYSAYATLRQDYYVDNVVIMSETGALGAGTSSPELRANQPPEIAIEGATEREVRVGEPVSLVARVVDDGQPSRDPLREAGITEDSGDEAAPTPRELLDRALRTPTATVTVSKRIGLHFTWFVYRGPGESVTIDPPQVKPWEDTRPYANSPWSVAWTPPEKPEDDRWKAEATFHEPGLYLLRGRADDGGLYSDVEVVVRVTRPSVG